MPATVATPEDLAEAVAPLQRQLDALKAAVTALQGAQDPGGDPPDDDPPAVDPRITRAPRFAPTGAALVIGATVTRESGVYVVGRPVAGRRFRNGADLGDIGGKAAYTFIAADAGQPMLYEETVELPDGTSFPARSAVVVPTGTVQIQGKAGLTAPE